MRTMHPRSRTRGTGVIALVVATLAAAGTAQGADPAPGAGADAGALERVVAFRAQGAIAAGARVSVTGRVAPASRARVRLQRRAPGGSWTPWATLTADARGRFSADVPLRASASVRALVLGSGEASAGRARSVTVRRAVSATRVHVDPTEAIAGRPVRVSAIARPAHPGERVVVEARRAGGAWRPLARPAAAVGGRVTTRVRLPAGGAWQVRTRAPRDRGRVAAAGAPARVTVFGRNPHGVPREASHYIVQMIDEMRLYYYEDGRLRRVLPVVFGAPGTPTPSGRYRVYAKGPGPRAAFGPLVLWYHRGYGIHGTNEEHLLSRTWRYYSHGCTRNYNANIRWLWPRVPVGTPVVNIR